MALDHGRQYQLRRPRAVTRLGFDYHLERSGWVGDASSPLLTFYQGWSTYQRMLAEMLGRLSRDQLALPAGAHGWTIGMIAQHVVANRVWWFQTWMGEGAPQLAPIAHWDPADQSSEVVVGAPELVTGFDATWAMIEDALSGWTAADLETVFQPPDTLSPDERTLFSPATRGWIIWHVLEHEIHHGGELSLALGAHGLPGIYRVL